MVMSIGFDKIEILFRQFLCWSWMPKSVGIYVHESTSVYGWCLQQHTTNVSAMSVTHHCDRAHRRIVHQQISSNHFDFWKRVSEPCRWQTAAQHDCDKKNVADTKSWHATITLEVVFYCSNCHTAHWTQNNAYITVTYEQLCIPISPLPISPPITNSI
jgi:predicted CXXCH cytochrome family protein